MVIKDVFSVGDWGIIVTGRIETGMIKVGDETSIFSGNERLVAIVIGIEKFHKKVQTAEAGDDAGLILEGVDRDQLARGMEVRSRL